MYNCLSDIETNECKCNINIAFYNSLWHIRTQTEDVFDPICSHVCMIYEGDDFSAGLLAIKSFLFGYSSTANYIEDKERGKRYETS